ncbi:MAG: rhodanese-like domain-containing protein [Flavobacteriaceae bacterium]|jgi:rhodanese-related sulfurtransferase|nr:rhodanese-like domain-containing protein [Flavobacteriaceae bacterium]MDG1791217.1 rhodanese-like domain-containing protein [Flavobacteriaceae bacterium]MDG2447544.1 rhodanese-like domain-containing protein [Flavobacteriaceae bacterium]|tara:strand:- start:375 stop:686 length:312 start_codon:yes stop_codon:yes gene_type:complete
MENINNTEFKELISENSGAVIIDCRTEIEWDEGRIKNAILLDLFESQLFMQKVEGFDKNKIYLVYCRSGSRSVAACQILESVGIKNVYNLTGGISSWDGDIII